VPLLLGSLARREGCRIATGGSDNFCKRAEAAGLPAHVMQTIGPLLESLKTLNRQMVRPTPSWRRSSKKMKSSGGFARCRESGR